MAGLHLDGLACGDCGGDLAYVEHYDEHGGTPGVYERVRVKCVECGIGWTLTLTLKYGWNRPAVTTPRPEDRGRKALLAKT